jgi:hypothetical protein
MGSGNSRLRNTSATATDFFGKSERWLWQNTAPRGPIPCIRLGKSVLYDWAMLEQFLAEQAAGCVESEVSRDGDAQLDVASQPPR